MTAASVHRAHLGGMPPFLPVAEPAAEAVAAGWPRLWWVGCHGGAGTSTVAALAGVGADAGTTWPLVDAVQAVQPVVLVARASAAGLVAANGAVEQWRRNAVTGVRVLGLVVVAASVRRPPKVVIERMQLVSGWVPALWRFGWVESYVAVEDPAELGTPPDIAKIRAAVNDALDGDTDRTGGAGGRQR